MTKIIKVSESVCAGHPDKLADQISDAILDEALRQDVNSRIAVETLVAKNTVVIAGEIRTLAHINYDNLVKRLITQNGYTNSTWGFDKSAQVINRIHEQSPEIAIGVDNDGAGDQGLMYGYATDETDKFLPLPIVIAHEICQAIDSARQQKTLAYLRPDGKSQVAILYENGKPVNIEHITVAVPHDEDVAIKRVRQDIITVIVKPILKQYGFTLPDELIVNGTGVWHIPGPASDVGLTGRKIVVDTYGGAARVGGGAFSGKDPSKVDRSGAYAARYIAKNIVAAGLAQTAEVCLAYYIGAKRPIVYTINTFDTQKTDISKIYKFAHTLIDTSVKGIIKGLELHQPIYTQTSVYGHFGKPNLPWEAIQNVL